jgi:anti-anti-sigma factor
MAAAQDEGFGIELCVIRRRDRVVVIAEGELDLSTGPQLVDCLADLLASGTSSIDLMLDGVTFIDCHGLGVLVSAHRRCRGRGCDLRLLLPRPQTRRLLELTGLGGTFAVVPAVEPMPTTAARLATLAGP